MPTPKSPKPRPTLLRVAVGVVFCAGIAAIAGWSLPERVTSDHRVELATRSAYTGIPDTTGGGSIPAQVTGNARSRVPCARCGVIESVRQIERREEIIAECTVGDAADARFPGILVEVAQRTYLATLAETVDAAIIGDQVARKPRVTTRHQIVVRFRDGSRHVFNEDTPRMLREGDRIQVIAGGTASNG